MSESMIERIAARMYDWEAEIAGVPQRWKNIPERARMEWHDMARSVLIAMREPTEEMVVAGNAMRVTARADGLGSRAATKLQWQAMIDAALKETSE